MTRFKTIFMLILTVIYAMIAFWAAWSPVDRFIWFLENILVIIFFIVFIFIHKYYTFSIPSYLFIFFFITLHTIGAHYSYQTPIDPWLKQWFELDRAYYDRFVHLSFGLFMILPIKDWLKQLIPYISIKILYFFSISTLFAAASFYELIEMWVAKIVAKEQGTVFIGLQDDPWDTQHDMELALYGSLFTLIIYTTVVWLTKKIKLRKNNQ